MNARLNNAIGGLILSVLFLGFTSGVDGYSLALEEKDSESFFSINAISVEGLKYPLWDQDPLSSGWILNINGSSISTSDNGWKRDYRISEGSHSLQYSNRTFSFEQSASVSVAGNHVLINVRFINNSTESVNFAPTLLLDTSLGEITGLPFQLPDGTFISKEQYYEGSEIPDWLITEKSSDTPALTIMMDGRAATRPESLTLANWLRLKQEGSSFIPVDERNLSYLPFSEMDSAILLSYAEKSVGSGDSLEIELVLGLDAHPPDSGAYLKSDTLSVRIDVENARLREYTLRQRLEDVRSVLDALDNLLDNSEVVTREAIMEIDGRTANQERLRAEYENL
jgi:hypothetical protein